MKTLLMMLFTVISLACVVLSEETSPSILQLRLVSEEDIANFEAMVMVQSYQGREIRETVYVLKQVLLDSRSLKSAFVAINPLDGLPRIRLVFTDLGRERFAEITRQNIGRRLAIIVDGRLMSAPVIRTEIPGGQAEISGNFSRAEAESLANQLMQSLSDD